MTHAFNTKDAQKNPVTENLSQPLGSKRLLDAIWYDGKQFFIDEIHTKTTHGTFRHFVILRGFNSES